MARDSVMIEVFDDTEKKLLEQFVSSKADFVAEGRAGDFHIHVNQEGMIRKLYVNKAYS